MKMAAQEPLKRSPLYHAARKRGATLGVVHGWEVAARFGSHESEREVLTTNAGLADVSWLTKLEVKGRTQFLRALRLPAGNAWHLGRGHSLITCDPPDKNALVAAIAGFVAQTTGEPESPVKPEAQSQTPCLHTTDVTSVYAALLLAGPASREVLQRLAAPDVSDGALPNESCLSARVAGLHARVLRRDMAGVLAYRLLVGAEYAEYAWDAILQTGRHLGIMPVGSAAVADQQAGDR